jgi:peptide deformylase
MILDVVKYGTPVLRQKGQRVEAITREVAQLIEDMLETMYENKGVGLAAQQVGQALQVATLDVRGCDRPSTMEVNGKPVNVEEYMPLVLVNPVITPLGVPVAGAEGCLSFPEVYADVVRPEDIEVKAINEDGAPVEFRCGGLLARAIQHEFDHLQGILFIDRMDKKVKEGVRADLDAIQAETKAELKKR